MTEDSTVHLIYDCRNLEEYNHLYVTSDEREITLSYKESPKRLKMWTEVFSLLRGEVRTMEEWATYVVGIHPPPEYDQLGALYRRVVAVCAVGKRDRDHYPERLKVKIGASVDVRVKVITKEPEDYHFLKWVWKNLDDFWKGDTSIMEEAYTKRTGKDSPYEDEEVVRMRKMIKDYKAAIGDKHEMEPPSLIEHLAYETDDLPGDEEVVSSIGGAIGTYYSPRYSSGILHANKAIRTAVKKTDKLWAERLRWCTSWKHKWEMGDEDVELEMGSTCESVLERWREEYEQLCILEPNKRYPIVKEGDYYVYDVDTLPLYTDGRWDQQLVDESIKEGHVIGVFAYTSEEKANGAQNKRLLFLSPSLPSLLSF